MYERVAIDEKVVAVYAELREKMNIQTGYGDELTKIRAVLHHFRYSDPSGAGLITFDQFLVFMLRLNFVGINAIVEEIFNRYDPDFTGYADSHDIAYGFFNRSSFPQLSGESLSLMEDIRQLWQSRGLFGPLDFCQALRHFPEVDAEGNMYWRSALGEIGYVLENRWSNEELTTLLKEFDLHKNGSFSVPMFIRVFLSGMNFDRKRLVRALFDKLDARNQGFVSESTIRRAYVGGTSSATVHGFRLDSMSTDRVLKYMQQHPSVVTPNEIPWPAFLSFYTAVSMGNDDHTVFEFIVRNSWSIEYDISYTLSPAGKKKGPNDPARRGLLIKHSSGREEVVDVIDELGKTRLDTRSLSAICEARGIHDIADIRI